METFLYSKSADELYGSDILVTPDGDIRYTARTDEAKYGNWKDNYKWPDANVVFSGDATNMRIIYGMEPSPDRIIEKYPFKKYSIDKRLVDYFKNLS